MSDMTNAEASRIISKMLATTDLTVRGNMKGDMVKACRKAIEVLNKQSETDDSVKDTDKAKQKKTGIWLLDGAYGNGSHWYCSECGTEVKMENWNCPNLSKCPKCNVDIILPEDLEREFENFID